MTRMPGKSMATIFNAGWNHGLAVVNRCVMCAGVASALLAMPATSLALDARYTTWEKDWPQYAVLALKPGVDTRETVIAALGKPKAAITEARGAVPHDVREACEESVYKHQFDNVLTWQGRMSFKSIGTPYKGEQSLALYFDAKGLLCGGNLQRTWTLPGGVTRAQLLLLDYPGKGWLGGEWKEVAHWFR